MEDKKDDGHVSPTSSPPTPPSPLPVSVGPGNQKYIFSASPTPSPPFSQPHSSQTSAENLPLLQEKLGDTSTQVPLAFSLDMPDYDESDTKSTCLADLLQWFIERCCNCCSTSR